MESQSQHADSIKLRRCLPCKSYRGHPRKLQGICWRSLVILYSPSSPASTGAIPESLPVVLDMSNARFPAPNTALSGPVSHYKPHSMTWVDMFHRYSPTYNIRVY